MKWVQVISGSRRDLKTVPHCMTDSWCLVWVPRRRRRSGRGYGMVWGQLPKERRLQSVPWPAAAWMVQVVSGTDSMGGPSGAPGHTDGPLIIAAVGVPGWSLCAASSYGRTRTGARLLPPRGVRGGLAGSRASFSMWPGLGKNGVAPPAGAEGQRTEAPTVLTACDGRRAAASGGGRPELRAAPRSGGCWPALLPAAVAQLEAGMGVPRTGTGGERAGGALLPGLLTAVTSAPT